MPATPDRRSLLWGNDSFPAVVKGLYGWNRCQVLACYTASGVFERTLCRFELCIPNETLFSADSTPRHGVPAGKAYVAIYCSSRPDALIHLRPVDPPRSNQIIPEAKGSQTTRKHLA